MAKKQEQLAFYNDIMNLFSKEELESFLLNQNEFFAAYAEDYWLLKYHKLKKEEYDYAYTVYYVFYIGYAII